MSSVVIKELAMEIILKITGVCGRKNKRPFKLYSQFVPTNIFVKSGLFHRTLLKTLETSSRTLKHFSLLPKPPLIHQNVREIPLQLCFYSKTIHDKGTFRAERRRKKIENLEGKEPEEDKYINKFTKQPIGQSVTNIQIKLVD